MGAHVKLSGSWSNVSDIYARVGGSWKEVTEGYVKLSGAWKQFFSAGTPLTVEYLVVAGGGAGAWGNGGAGGAGGYRTATGFIPTVGTNYTVTVGAGAARITTGVSQQEANGSDSVFATITSSGGGGGASFSNLKGSLYNGKAGGSGGGAGGTDSGAVNTGGAGNTPSTSPAQGNNGGNGTANPTSNAGGGGGGASAAGANGTGTSTAGNGGAGLASSITGTSVTRAGGGGGGSNSGGAGTGGAGGGGNGGLSAVGSPGAANTGGGGGGGGNTNVGGNGGSGIVILKYPDTYGITVGAGLTSSTTTSGGFSVTTFTAGTGSVSFTLLSPFTLTYLVIAGGGGGGDDVGGGGGAGGYRTASDFTGYTGTSYTLTVGSGGSRGPYSSATPGGNSVFGPITSAGGGRGAGYANAGGNGGSGGGGGSGAAGGAGNTPATTPSQGNNGASGAYINGPGAGGGGAGAAGSGVNGGAGSSSSITGTAVTRAGGGAGGSGTSGEPGGTGGSGGGGNPGVAGTVNTGSGGGGGNFTQNAANGGSGIVILKYPDTYAISVSPGLNHMTTTSGGYRITQFLAGTGTVSFSEAAASDYELIGSVYLSSSQASVTFDLTGLSSTYKHLQIRGVARTDRGGADSDPVILQFNGDTGANYTRHGLGAYRFNGSGTHYSNSATSQTSIMVTENMPVSSSTANVFGVFVADILDPFQSTKNKTVRTLNGMNAAWASIELRSGAWLSTTPASSILLKPLVGANFVANCRFSIYGLKG